MLKHITSWCLYCTCVCACVLIDLDEVSEDKVKELCADGHVFFNCLGTTRAIAGSKVRINWMKMHHMIGCLRVNGNEIKGLPSGDAAR